MDLTLPATAFPPDAEADSLLSDFANWKQSQPLTEASRRHVAEEKAALELGTHQRLTDVMGKIMAYSVEQHSPIECMAFLAELQQLRRPAGLARHLRRARPLLSVAKTLARPYELVFVLYLVDTLYFYDETYSF